MILIMKSNTVRIIAGVVLLAATAVIWRYGFPNLVPITPGKAYEATLLSQVALVGLALVVMFMAILAIVYSGLGVADLKQALALPEGSVRALIAFSLLLMFVCMTAFLYGGVNQELIPAGSAKITETQLNAQKDQFTVIYEPAKDDKGSPQFEKMKDDKGVPTSEDNKSKPLYDVRYFIKHSKDGDDFAKQIFTTLATVFVSVIAFYFGSSATKSGVGAGVLAATGSKEGDPQSAVTDAKAAAHDAQSAADRAAVAAKTANDRVTQLPGDAKALSDAKAVQAQSDAATKAAQAAKDQADAAAKAAVAAAAAGTDSAKASAAMADAFKARDAAKAAADTAKQSADEAERLLKQ